MKINKIVVALSLVLVAGFLFLFTGGSDASQVHYKITVSDETVEKGNEVMVSFTVTGENPMNSVDAYVYYDDSILEFISADKDVFTGTTGVLKLNDVFTEEVKEVDYQLKFKALEVGQASLKVQEMYVGEEKEEISTVDNVSTIITVKENHSESKDATLETLEVFPDTLTPAFEKDVVSYEMTVDNETDDIVISAIPTDSESVVTVSGNENFKHGKNTVTITVTSISGFAKEHKIIVNKQ